MKVKKDFVTNSSSTSFIFCVNKKITSNEILEDGKDLIEKYDEDDMVDILISLENFINCGAMYEYDDPKIFRVITELFHQFEIATIEVSSDCGECQLVYIEDLNKRFENETKTRLRYEL